MNDKEFSKVSEIVKMTLLQFMTDTPEFNEFDWELLEINKAIQERLRREFKNETH